MVRLVLGFLLLIAAPAMASLDAASRCCADRLRVTGARERRLLNCHARAAARGVPVDAACVADVDASLARLFARIVSTNFECCTGTCTAGTCS